MHTNHPAKDHYLCPNCNHVAQGEGLCPRHRTPLLNYHAWMEFKRKPVATSTKTWLPILLVLLVSVVGYATYRLAKELILAPPAEAPAAAVGEN